MSDPIKLHQKLQGKIEVKSKIKINSKNLPLIYTPGVGKVSQAVAKDKTKIFEYTGKNNSVAIVTDGSAVLGLGNIGPEAALPVMEGKAAIFSEFAQINAVPICLATQDTKEIINIVKNIAPSFGGINLEDISAPRCFKIESILSKELDIPVFHDDQHGTAIVVLAGLINALKVVKKDKNVKMVISGAGAAGIAIAKLLSEYGLNNYCLCDSKGVISQCRVDLNGYKKEIFSKSKNYCPCAGCSDVLKGADVLIGVSQPDQFTAKDIKAMNKNAIVFALANPKPEIMPNEAKKGGALVVATGRSDFENQINNALVFPGLFKGLFEAKIKKVTYKIKIATAEAIAGLIKTPKPGKIIPSIFDKKVVKAIVRAISEVK